MASLHSNDYRHANRSVDYSQEPFERPASKRPTIRVQERGLEAMPLSSSTNPASTKEYERSKKEILLKTMPLWSPNDYLSTTFTLELYCQTEHTLADPSCALINGHVPFRGKY